MTNSRAVRAEAYVGVLMLAMGAVQGASPQVLTNHVPAAVHESRQLGPVFEMANLHLAFGLPLRNREELDRWNEQIADPASANYRHYLTASEFAERFGPTQEDYDKLSAFLQSNGFTISGKFSNRMILDVTGSVGTINKTLHTTLTMFEHPVRGRFFAPDRDPSIETDVPVLDISGLDNLASPRPMDLKTLPLTSATPLGSGSGPGGLYIGKDFRAAYAPAVSMTGAGQTIGLVEFDGFYPADVVSNFKQAGLTPVPVSTVLLDGFNGVPGSANIEVILDIVMAGYMAPGASVIVYEGENANDVLNRMATDNLAKQLSCSWGYGINSTTEQIFKQMIAQGQSFFTASGDSGAYANGVMPPADDPNVTSVGGTALTTAGAGGAWVSESAWSGSGGGVSTSYPIPSYQQGMNMAAQGASSTMRNIPDVALTGAVQMFLIFNNGAQTAVGGTSAATPLWAAFTALANQQAAASSKPAVGFLNPAIYAIGNNATSYAAALHDITTGNNGFPALPGYDLTTGWGSPSGQALINDLSTGVMSTPGYSLKTSATAVSVTQGSTAAATITISPTNGFNGAVALTLSGLPAGVTASFNPASTSTNSTLTFTAAPTAAASTATVTITGKSGTLSATANLTLTVAPVATFTMSTSTPTLSVVQGASGNSTITVTPKPGFTGSATLTITGLPSGVTAVFTPASTASTSTLKLTASALATLGAATVTVIGTNGAMSAQATIALTINAPPSFKLSSSVSNVSVTPGSSGTASLTITPQGGFTGTVALTATGLPAGITASFSPASASSTSTLTLSVTSGTAAKAYPFTINGVSGALTASVAMTVTVVPPPDFGIALTPTSLRVLPGGKGTTAISLVPLNGFAGNVALSATALPAGITASFTALNSGVVLALFNVSGSAAPATTSVNITGVSGALIHTAILSLTVVAPSAGSTTIDLSPNYNVAASAVDNIPFTGGGLDGGGRSYSGILLGGSQSINGTMFSIGPMGLADAVSGQSIALPAGQFTSLKMLATAVNGNQPAQTFTVTYTDGSTSSFSQSLSDWFTPQNYSGESQALTMNYRDNSTGTLDGEVFHLYGYSFTLSAAKTVRSISVPQNRNVVVMAITLVTSTNAIGTALVDLSKAFNGTGIVSDGKTFTGGLDGVGYAYSGSLLQGLQSFSNIQAQIGTPNQANVVSGSSVPIPLPSGNYSSLVILGTGVNGTQVSQSFKITYTDGTSASFTQSLSDWFTPANYAGEQIALTMPYRDAANGTEDKRAFALYEYTFSLNNTKTVSSIALPANSNVKVFAIVMKP